MSYQLRRYESVAAFANAVLPFLAEDEIANNLQLGLIGRLLESDEREATLLAAVTKSDDVVGVAILAPGRHLVLTQFPEDAVPAVMDALHGLRVPGVVAPALLADAVASVGRYAVAFQADRIVWRLDQVSAEFRSNCDVARASDDDVSLLCDWLTAFYEEVREPTPTSLSHRVRELVAQGRFFLCVVDGSPVSMTAIVRETPCAGILSFVYTPSTQRGQGYAAACVVSACRVVFELGKRWCVLNSRANNAPANAVYRRVGFLPVAELRQVTFGC